MKFAVRLVDSSGQSWFGAWSTSSGTGCLFGKLVRSLDDFGLHHPRYLHESANAEERAAWRAELEGDGGECGSDDPAVTFEGVVARVWAALHDDPTFQPGMGKDRVQRAVDHYVAANAWPYELVPQVFSTSSWYRLLQKGWQPGQPRPETCACAFCRLPVYDDQLAEEVAQHPVYEHDGTLDYIELAHRRCAPLGWDQRILKPVEVARARLRGANL